MDALTIGYIALVVFILLLFTGMPIGFVMLLVGTVGAFFVVGLDHGLSILRTIPYRYIASYTLTTLPLFLLMGSICFNSRISRGLFTSAYTWLGHLRGGLAIATVGACAAFSAVCGSSMACAATMGMVALPEMKRYKYADTLATGCVAAGGTMGTLIPPSVGFIIYGLLAEQSIGKLFMAGILPGISQAIFYIVIIYIICRLDPAKGPQGPNSSLKEKFTSLGDTWVVALLFAVVMGGMYLGVFSPTEGAGVGAFVAFIFAIARKRLTKEGFMNSLLDSAKTTATIFVIVIGAMIFVAFLALTKLPQQLSALITALEVNRYIVLSAMLFCYLVLGCFMEPLGMAMLTIPIFLPVVLALGFDPIWFGVLQVRLSEIGMITPPVGMNVFVIKGMSQDVSLSTIFKGIVPFFIADLFHVVLLVSFPIISLLIPNLMFVK